VYLMLEKWIENVWMIYCFTKTERVIKYILKLNIIWRELSKKRFNLIKVLFFLFLIVSSCLIFLISRFRLVVWILEQLPALQQINGPLSRIAILSISYKVSLKRNVVKQSIVIFSFLCKINLWTTSELHSKYLFLILKVV